MSSRLSGLGTAIVAAIGIGSLLVWLDLSGFHAQDHEFLGAKALVARYGPDPRMQSVGFVFSPILVYGTLLLGSPITLQAVLSALAVGLCARQLLKVPVPRYWHWCWFGLIFLQPASILMFTLSPAWTLSTALLIGVVSRLGALLTRATHPGTAPATAAPPAIMAFLLFGLGLAPLMLVRYEAWLLLPLVAALLGILYRHESWPCRWTVMTVTLFMSLVLIGAWLYINWLFAADPWCFLTCPASGWRLPSNELLLQHAGFVDGWFQGMAWALSLVPAYVVVAAWVLWYTPSRLLWALMLLIPLLLPVAALWQGNFIPQLSQLGILLGLLPVLWRHFPPSHAWQRWVVTGALLLGLATSVQMLYRGQAIPEEMFVWSTLTRQPAAESPSFQQWLARQQSTRQVAAIIQTHRQSGQQILMDDVTSYPLMYLLDDSRPFLMPHQYEFSPALQHPDLFVDFLLVAGTASPVKVHDRLLRFWPQLEDGTLPPFMPLLTTPHYRLLQRVTTP